MKTYDNITLSGIDASGKKKSYALSDFKGEKVVLYFYPKNDTSLCTQEACSFRDKLSQTSIKTDKRPKIVGVSIDSVDSHRQFHKKEGLNFVLLSDPDRKLADAMDVPPMTGGVNTRTTFLLDEDGTIVKKWINVRVDGHADEVMAAMNRI